MFRRAAILLLLAAPALGQTFSTELSIGFGYAGGKVDEPLVAVDGVPSPSFAYRQDSTGRTLSVGAVRFFGGIPDDGVTPHALLPFVARRSSLGAAVSLTGASRDSYGIGRGTAVTIESRLTADASTWGGALEGTWFALPGWALHASAGRASFRETQALSSVQSPSGASVFGSSSPREDRLSGSLGVVARPSPDVAMEAAALLGSMDGRTTQAGLGSGADDTETESDSETLGAALSGRLLLLERRLALDVGARYVATHGRYEVIGSGGGGLSSHVITRAVGGTATCFPTRAFSLALGIDYASAGTTQGTGSELFVATRRVVTWRAAARFFTRGSASIALDLSRTVTDTVTPPERSSFTRFSAIDDRVALGAALRM